MVGLTETNKDNTDALIIIGSNPNVICTFVKTRLQMESISTVWPRDRALICSVICVLAIQLGHFLLLVYSLFSSFEGQLCTFVRLLSLLGRYFHHT